MRILLKGYYGFGNLGDDILMLVSYKLLKESYPKAEIVIFSNNSPNNPDAKYPPEYNQYIRNILNEDVEIIDWTYKGHFDLIFYGGGGVFFDERPGPFYYHPVNRLARWLGSVAVAQTDRFTRKLTGRSLRITGKVTIGAGLGVGPFHPAAPSFYRKLAETGRFDRLIVRDHLSFELLKRWGFARKSALGSDLAFLTNHWLPDNHDFPPAIDNRIAIVLKGHSPDLYSHYKTLAGQLAEEGYKVTFFAFDEYHDQDYIRHLQPEFTVKIWQPHQQKLTEFIRELWQATLCLTDRAHGAILAAIGQTVPVIIRTSPKSDQITNLLGLTEDIPSTANELYTEEDILKVLKNPSQVKTNLMRTVEQNISLMAGLVKSLPI